MLDYWFDGVGADGEPGPAAARRWFGGGRAVDEEIRERFGDATGEALRGGFVAWENAPRSRLALVVMLDQFTRNLYRGRAQGFDGDGRALALTRATLAAGEDAELSPVERYFLYMPLEHAEDAGAQDEAVRRFTALSEERPGSRFFGGGGDWAVRHQRTIERFGRFPSRNAALGRETTQAEAAFLRENPSGF